MLQLEGSVHEVADPEQVVHKQSGIAAELNSLLYGHNKTSVDMNIADKSHIEDQFESQCVRGPFVRASIVFGRSPLKSVLSCSIQHALNHHQDHEQEQQHNLHHCEVIEVNRSGLITRLNTCDALLKHEGVEEDHEEREEIAIEVVLARFDLVRVHVHDRDVLIFAKVAIRLSLVHVSWLQLQEEVLDFETELLE